MLIFSIEVTKRVAGFTAKENIFESNSQSKISKKSPFYIYGYFCQLQCFKQEQITPTCNVNVRAKEKQDQQCKSYLSCFLLSFDGIGLNEHQVQVRTFCVSLFFYRSVFFFLKKKRARMLIKPDIWQHSWQNFFGTSKEFFGRIKVTLGMF